MPKRTAQRYRVDAKPAKDSEWVRLGRDHYAQGIIEASFTPLRGDDVDEYRPSVWMLVALDARKRRQVYEVRITGDEPLSSTSIRLPLEAMARAAVACLSYRLDGDTAHLVALPGDTFEINKEVEVKHLEPERLAELERDARMRPRRNPVTEDELRKVAAIVERVPYRERRAAVEAELRVSPSVAKARIAEARRRDLVGAK